MQSRPPSWKSRRWKACHCVVDAELCDASDGGVVSAGCTPAEQAIATTAPASPGSKSAMDFGMRSRSKRCVSPTIRCPR
ncbi:MAG: hypothetical protein DCC67_11435 [Planctomycetota bacterium]|nr:MAG: hypothetical protein DCC67_11435 [Planctomycetota bacterium]